MNDFVDDSPPLIQYQNPLMRWIPVPVRQGWRRMVKWAKGPNTPHIHSIEPIFPTIQQAPIRLIDRYLPKWIHRIIVLVVFYSLWASTFAMVIRRNNIATHIEGWGKPVKIGCGDSYWLPGNLCGLNGNDCRPFNGSGFVFICPANCKSTWVLNPRNVGAQEVVYQSLVVGGPSEDHETPIYRSDSFICGAAIHAGVIYNSKGGCGIVSLVGQHTNYTSSKRNGIESISFDSTFPSSFTFYSSAKCQAADPRWQLLIVSLSFTIVLSVFTISPSIFFFSIFTGLFAHVGLASDPPNYSTIAGLISNILGNFLPATFCAVVIYWYMGVRRALTGLTALIEKTILWLGGCWVGALTNYTFDWIPIQRLNAYDLKQQPGAIAALIIIIITLVVIIVLQALYLRREGRLICYLGIYGVIIGAILLSLILPGLQLRLHHYIIALLLLPGTSMQTRPSLLFQGILVGLFINGVARWGFDAILQTPAALQGDAPYNSPLPVIKSPVIEPGGTTSLITFSWPMPPDPFDGISVLVNDVERFRGFVDEGITKEQQFIWERSVTEAEFFRFAYQQGDVTWDYTKAGIWTVDGKWTFDSS